MLLCDVSWPKVQMYFGGLCFLLSQFGLEPQHKIAVFVVCVCICFQEKICILLLCCTSAMPLNREHHLTETR